MIIALEKLRLLKRNHRLQLDHSSVVVSVYTIGTYKMHLDVSSPSVTNPE
jgi:hypothetical protein